MIIKDYYKILDFDTNKVTIDEIKSNFRELAKKYHPDVNVGDAEKEERFKDINEAYRVLSDTASRKKYDRIWNANIGKKKAKQQEATKSTESRTSDFFHMFFGNMQEVVEEPTSRNVKKKIPVKGDNVETQIVVSVQEAFYGAEKKISLRTVEGKMKTFTVKIPAGIRNGEKIRLIGQGKNGKNGGNNGDLFIQIKIENSKTFRLEGYDLVTDLYLTPWEAVLGTRVSISSIDDKVSVYVPQGIESGEKVRIPGKGYKDGKGSRGDLIAEIKIVVPKRPTEEELELFEKMKELSKFDPRKQYEA
mgnify:FL=1